MTNPDRITTSTDDADTQQGDSVDTAVLTVDGFRYDLDALGEPLRGLSEDLIRTEQDWQGLQHRLRQFVAMESAMVNSLKEEVERAGLQPDSTPQETPDTDRPMLTIDGQSYDASDLPGAVRVAVEDLLRNRQERQSLEFRLRQLEAARQGYGSAIREQLSVSGAQPLEG